MASASLSLKLMAKGVVLNTAWNLTIEYPSLTVVIQPSTTSESFAETTTSTPQSKLSAEEKWRSTFLGLEAEGPALSSCAPLHKVRKELEDSLVNSNSSRIASPKAGDRPLKAGDRRPSAVLRPLFCKLGRPV